MIYQESNAEHAAHEFIDQNLGLKVYTPQEFEQIKNQLDRLEFKTQKLRDRASKMVPWLYGHVEERNQPDSNGYKFAHPYCDDATKNNLNSIDQNRFRLRIKSNIYMPSYYPDGSIETLHNYGEDEIEVKTNGVLSTISYLDDKAYLGSQLMVGCVGDPSTHDSSNPEIIFVIDNDGNETLLQLPKIFDSFGTILIREVPEITLPQESADTPKQLPLLK